MTQAGFLPQFAHLQDALAVLSIALGKSAPTETITHGLPLDEGRLPLTHVESAAERAGISLSPMAPGALKAFHCPLLFAHPGGRAAIITEMPKDGHGLALADDGNTAEIVLGDLKAAGFNRCWLVKPAATRDDRVSREGHETPHHWLADALWMNRSIVGSVVAATVFTNILALATPLIMMNVMDRVVSHAAFETLWALALGGLLAIVFDFVLRTLRSTLIDRAGAASDVHINNKIFAKVLGTRLSARHGSVGVQSNTLREFESLREISNSATIATLGDLPFALLFLVVIAMVAGWMVVVPLAMIPILLASGLLTQRKLDKLVVEHFKDMAHKNAIAVEVLSNMETIKAHVGESWAATKWERAVASYLRHSLDMRRWTSFSTNIIQALQNFTTIVILVMGVYLITAGQMSGGALFAATMLTGRALSPIAQIAVLLTKLHHARTAYKSLRHLVDAEQERPDDARFLQTPSQLRSITLDTVSFAYRKDGEPALKSITLEISAGERIGIIGGIGSGKSTLLRILAGLRQPTSGTMSIDGLPSHQLDPASFRRRIGTSFREEGFFFGTIRENLSFHRPEASGDELVKASRMGGAIDWINALPQAFDTPVGEAGSGLSTGQRQTLALSRAFLGQPDILLLDEPTSDLDSRTEALLVGRLRTLPPGQTVIAVTHRPAVLEACSRLIVIDGGAIVLDGERTMVLEQLRNVVQAERNAKAA